MTEIAASAPAFGRYAPAYDAMRRKLVPCFDAFYGAALRLIDDWKTADAFRVLELGAGTGLFSAMIRERHPRAHIRLTDASDGMLEQARRRFAGDPCAAFAVCDMETASLEGPWDAIVSALAIHHLAHPAKQDLFARIRATLAPGGLFVNAEQVLGPDGAADERYVRFWLEDIRALGVPEEEIALAGERMSFDRCASVEDQLAWMRQAGLTDVDCAFKSWRFAVLSGRA
ncbi:MAG: class I SAM-dependent methyltransferase [Rhodospirillaceae bacterium]|nr:class I SAM-dependent methyltransferase [Rhodospirillaceae bacterium]